MVKDQSQIILLKLMQFRWYDSVFAFLCNCRRWRMKCMVYCSKLFKSFFIFNYKSSFMNFSWSSAESVLFHPCYKPLKGYLVHFQFTLKACDDPSFKCCKFLIVFPIVGYKIVKTSAITANKDRLDITTTSVAKIVFPFTV